jgi:succinoglycan biosynthesis protein ExoL
LRIAYFVHDVTDPAVARRVRMLQAGGAEVSVLGFRRGDVVPNLEGAPAIDLGRTYDSRLLQRTLKVIQRRTSLGVGSSAVRNADMLLARNLEMLAIASAAQCRHASKATLVYECLDLHRLLLSGSPVGRILRFLERSLMRQARLLIVSSPAFISRYYAPKQGVGSMWNLPVLIVENKVLDLDASHDKETVAVEPAPGPPWRIGWFGMIRCQRSLDILCRLASRFPGLVEIIIRGRPAPVAFRNFDEQIAQSSGVSFGGAYRRSELSKLYGGVHFNWAIDYFEEGANSALLLPNRIYEGGPYGAVPIALARTETGRWLQQRGIGVLFDSPGDELGCFLEHLSSSAYGRLRQAVRSQPRRSFVADRTDCESLVNALTLAARGEIAGDLATSDLSVHAAGSINTV